jgi:hypothetical protein
VNTSSERIQDIKISNKHLGSECANVHAETRNMKEQGSMVPSNAVIPQKTPMAVRWMKS